MSAPTIEPLPAHLTRRGGDPDELWEDYLAVVKRAIDAHPRSLQRSLGPSEVGTPCERKLGYKLLHHPERPMPPNWKATVGTACHTWMEGAFDADNLAQAIRLEGQERWLIETRLTCGFVPKMGFLTGHSDLYDRVTCSNLDHKFIGPTQLKHYKAKGPSQTYKAQAHLYGVGWQMAGLPIDRVAICFLPKQGELADGFMWSEALNPEAAKWALDRLGRIVGLVDALGSESLPVLPTAEDWCDHCPFMRFGSSDPKVACPGHPGSRSTQPETPALTFGDPAQPALA